jgi:hypothetical protein
MFAVKYELEKQNSPFDLSFVYKSTFKQPPAPFPFEPSDFITDEAPKKKI